MQRCYPMGKALLPTAHEPLLYVLLYPELALLCCVSHCSGTVRRGPRTRGSQVKCRQAAQRTRDHKIGKSCHPCSIAADDDMQTLTSVAKHSALTCCRREVEVLGLVLLHPTAEDEGDVGPSFARLLGNSRYVPYSQANVCLCCPRCDAASSPHLHAVVQAGAANAGSHAAHGDRRGVQ